MIHTVCETTNLGAVKFAERIFDAVADIDVDNGTIGYLDGLTETQDIYKFVAGAKEGAQAVLAHNPEWDYDECRITNQRKDKFFNPEGERFRAYVLKMNDEFTLTEAGFVGKPEVGKFATIDATGKLAICDAKAEGQFCVEIMRKRTQGATLVTSVRDYGYAQMMYTAKVVALA